MVIALVGLTPGCLRYGFGVGEDGSVSDSTDAASVDIVASGEGATPDGLPDGAATDAGPDHAASDGDLALPDLAPLPDAPLPDLALPDVALTQDAPPSPDMALPDLAPVPDMALPDLAPSPDMALPDLAPLPDMALPDAPLPPDQTVGPLWWNTAYPYRARVQLSNNQSTAWVKEPLFLTTSQLGNLMVTPRESSIRVVRWDGSSHTEVPFALHDWSTGLAGLNDANGDLDSNDELLLLVDIPASGSVEYQIYYDSVDHAPALHLPVTVSGGGTGFPNVTVDGTTASREYLTFTDGVDLYKLMLVDSIPYWNHTSNYTFESSAIGPRINDMFLPGGTEVFPTVDHTTGSGSGDLVHTIRLGPFRLSGNFSIFSSSQAFYSTRLVSTISHSQVQAWSRPIAAVVLIDAELYCDEPDKCNPARDYGDVKLVGYLFDRGPFNEVLMRWRGQAQMDGTNTISAAKSSESEFYNLVAYMIESYCEAQFGSLIDLDTVRLKEKGTGTVSSAQFDNTKGDDRLCKETDDWILMSDTDSPYKGVIALLPEGSPVINGSAAPSRACWWVDGNSGIELNGFQSEWHLSPSAFSSWGSNSSDTVTYAYWIHAFPRTSADDQEPANTRTGRIHTPPTIVVTTEQKP